MIPVMKDKIVSRDGHGTCYNACIASILEKSIDEVGHIYTNEEGDWRERWRVWLAGQGFKVVYYWTDDDDDLVEGYTIASVTTTRVYPKDHHKAGQQIFHAVVALDGVIVHDPFPGGSEITEIFYHEKLEPLSDAERHLHEAKIFYGECLHGYKMNCRECNKPEETIEEA